jgi:hypothetical protein
MLNIPHLEKIVFFFLRIQRVFVAYDFYHLIEGDTLNSFLLFFLELKHLLNVKKGKILSYLIGEKYLLLIKILWFNMEFDKIVRVTCT